MLYKDLYEIAGVAEVMESYFLVCSLKATLPEKANIITNQRLEN